MYDAYNPLLTLTNHTIDNENKLTNSQFTWLNNQIQPILSVKLTESCDDEQQSSSNALATSTCVPRHHHQHQRPQLLPQYQQQHQRTLSSSLSSTSLQLCSLPVSPTLNLALATSTASSSLNHHHHHHPQQQQQQQQSVEAVHFNWQIAGSSQAPVKINNSKTAKAWLSASPNGKQNSIEYKNDKILLTLSSLQTLIIIIIITIIFILILLLSLLTTINENCSLPFFSAVFRHINFQSLCMHLLLHLHLLMLLLS